MRTVRSIVAGLFALLTVSIACAATCDGFTDVDSGASYCTAVIYLKDHGITLGCTGTAYCPDAYVTRAQMALFLLRAGQTDPSNTLGDHTTTIGGGLSNLATGFGATVSGGLENAATGEVSTVVGGEVNSANGAKSTVLGGAQNTATGAYSMAAGFGALANEDFCAIVSLWGLPGTSTYSFGCNHWTNVFRVGANNGMSVDYGVQTANGNSNDYVYIGPKFDGHAISTGTGAYLSTGGTWANGSDRNSKTDVVPIDAQAVLDKVAALPISQWRYKVETSQTHLGPMAQDFHAAFGLGADDTHITTVDEGGVALAAIQGLNEKLETQVKVLTARLSELEKQISRRRMR